MIIPLDPANYYMSHVPIYFSISALLMINLFVLGITAIALFIPLAVISRVTPIKAVKFD
jgi:lipoprotein-releasing system permease protein